MTFYLKDFTEEAQEVIRKNYNFDEDGPCATFFQWEDTENCSYISGTWENIQKLIPIFKEMGYDDLHLFYEDSGIWVLYYHNFKLDGMEWRLIR